MDWRPIKVLGLQNLMKLSPKKRIITISRWNVSGRETSHRFIGFKKLNNRSLFLKGVFQSDSIVSATEVGNVSSLLNNSTRNKLIIIIKKPKQKTRTHKLPKTLHVCKA